MVLKAITLPSLHAVNEGRIVFGMLGQTYQRQQTSVRWPEPYSARETLNPLLPAGTANNGMPHPQCGPSHTSDRVDKYGRPGQLFRLPPMNTTWQNLHVYIHCTECVHIYRYTYISIHRYIHTSMHTHTHTCSGVKSRQGAFSHITPR